MPSTPISPQIGVLHLERARASPNGAEEASLYLLAGDATAGPIRAIEPGPGVTLPEAPACLAQDDPFLLCILHFSDLHDRLADVSSLASRPVFSRIAHHLEDLRGRVRGNPRAAVLVMSGGDDLIGAVFDELLGDSPERYGFHPAYRLYSAAGVDVGVLGNHDLDLGLPMLAHAIRRDARFPLLSANLAPLDGDPLPAGIYSAALLVAKGVRVGVLGLTTPAEIKLRPHFDFRVADPIAAARNLLPALAPLCDVIVVLSHLGYSLATSSAAVAVAGDVELANALPYAGVDLIIGAHTHLALNENGLSARNIVNGIPIVQAGAGGRYLGEVHVTVRSWPGRAPSAAVSDARLIPVDSLPADRAFEETHVRPIVAAAQALLRSTLGKVADHPDLNTWHLRDRFASGESALANFITDAMVARCRLAGLDVDLAAIDASSVCDGLPRLDVLTYGDWFDLMPFADTICLYRLTASELRALLDDNARRSDRPNEAHTERGFLHFSRDLRYAIALGSDRAAARIADVTVDGVPLKGLLAFEERIYTLACSSFVRRSSASWEACAAEETGLDLLDLGAFRCTATGLLLREQLVAHIRGHGGVTEEGGLRRDGRLQFRV